MKSYYKSFINKLDKTILEVQYELTEIDQVVQILLDKNLLDEPIILLQGDLGAGKTTLVKTIVGKLGIKDLVSSPTFSLVNEYTSEKYSIFHMDLYRLNSLEEAIDIGLEEYFDEGHCFIEWPNIIESILPPSYTTIKLEILGKFTRMLRLLRTSNH